MILFQQDSIINFLKHNGANDISFLFQKRVLSGNHVQLFATPWTLAHQAPLSMGILQARILEWVAKHSFKGSSQSSDWTQVSRIPGGFFTVWTNRQALQNLNLGIF